MENKSLKRPSVVFLSSITPKLSTKKIPETDLDDKKIKTELILNLINMYDLNENDVDCFKILLIVFNDYNLIKFNINNNFNFIDIIKLIYSKCNKDLSLLQKQKVLDYLNYDEEIPQQSDCIEYKECKEFNKFNYNMSKLNDNIDFSILGTNIIRNTKMYKKKKNKNSNIYSRQKEKISNNNIINNKEYEDDDDNNDDEFVDIQL